MAKDRKKLVHIHSKITDKQPRPEALEVGEIAVNNGVSGSTDRSFLSIKNADNKVVRFSSDEQMIFWTEKKEVIPFEGQVRGEDGPQSTKDSGDYGSYGITNDDLLNNKSNLVIKFNQVAASNTPKSEVINGGKDIYGKLVNGTPDASREGAGIAVDMSRYAMRGANPSFSSLTIDNGTTLGGDLNVSGNTRINKNLTVSGNTNVSGSTTIKGNTNISGNTRIDKNLTVSGNTNVSGNTKIGNGLNVTGATNINGATKITGDTTFNGNETVNGNLTVTSNTNISGDTRIKKTLTVDGATKINNDLTVTGNTNISGNTRIDKNLTVSGNTFISGNTTIDKNLTVNGDTNLQKISATTISATTISGTNANITNLTTNTISGGTLNVSGNTTLNKVTANTISASSISAASIDIKGGLSHSITFYSGYTPSITKPVFNGSEDTKVTIPTVSGYPDKAEYNSTDKKIYFKHNNTTLTSMTIDAKAFIKDGMIDSVSIVHGTWNGDTFTEDPAGPDIALKIVWNLDSTKDTIYLNIGDLFEADNYFTRDQLTGTTNYVTVRKAYSANTASTAITVALSGVTGADDLKKIEALTGTSGLLKKTAANTWTLDTTDYSNKNAFGKIKINAESTTIDSDTTNDTLTISGGSFVTLTSDAANDKFTIGVSTGKTSSTLARGDHSHSDYVPSGLTIIADSGLTGGGKLSGDVKIGLAEVGSGSTYGPTSNVTGTNNTTVAIPYVKTDKYGRVTSAGTITYTSQDTHHTTRIYVGTSGTSGNSVSSNPYVKVTDNNTYKNQIRLSGTGAVSINSTSGGVVTISGTNTTYSAGRAIDITNKAISLDLPISAGTGTNSIIEGENTTASGNYSHAEGLGTSAIKGSDHAEGENTTASGGTGSHAEGYLTKAIGQSSHAEGWSTSATSIASHAEGDSTTAIGSASHAEGTYTVANNEAEHASGIYNVSRTGSTDGDRTLFTVGNGTSTSNRKNAFEIRQNGDTYVNGVANVINTSDTTRKTVIKNSGTTISHIVDGTGGGTAITSIDSSSMSIYATGYQAPGSESITLDKDSIKFERYYGASGSVVSSSYSKHHILTINSNDIELRGNVAEGDSTVASGISSHAEGVSTTAYGDYSHAEGENTTASGASSHAEGYNTTASSTSSHAEGSSTNALGARSHAEGYRTTASGTSSHAEGRDTTASANYSHAEGYSTTASGTSSHAEGSGTTAIGACAHAEGENTTASGASSHAEGSSTKALGAHSHAEGDTTTASGQSSHAEGAITRAIGQYSHAEGVSTTASGQSSHAEGDTTTASGTSSHAEGTSTNALGTRSHAEGYYTQASGNYSHAEGNHTETKNQSEHASGQYNVSSSASTTFGDGGNTLFSVGNGTSSTNRKNAFEIRQNGDAIIGSIDDQGQITNNKLYIYGESYYSAGIAGHAIRVTPSEIIATGPTTWSIKGTGMTAQAFYATSDERLKENIENVSYAKMANAANVDIKSFNFKNDEEKKTVIGVIAQDVEKENLGFIVSTSDDGMKAVDYTGLSLLKIAYLEQKIKELENIINELKENKQ